jgi:GMP synthase (glutamine-hydrolysing)
MDWRLLYVSSMASNHARDLSTRRTGDEILVLLHQAHSTTGRVGRLLRSFGYALDIRYPLSGDDLPHSLDRYAGVVVFGGPMSATDSDVQLRREINWLETPLVEKKPFLGLCLGAQMMALQMGARVYRPASQRGELGYSRIRPATAADGICGVRFPRFVYHWHFDGFDVPVGASRLAEGEGDFPNQAFICEGNVVGLQFHPEVTYQMMCRWTTRSAARLGHSGAPSRQEHLDGWFQYDRAVDKWISSFLRAWARDDLTWPQSTSDVASYAIAAE